MSQNKAFVLGYMDAELPLTGTGTTALNTAVVRARVIFVGPNVPDGVMEGAGTFGNGVPIQINLNQLGQYPALVVNAVMSEAARLGVTGLQRSDVLFPTYQRGS